MYIVVFLFVCFVHVFFDLLHVFFCFVFVGFRVSKVFLVGGVRC